MIIAIQCFEKLFVLTQEKNFKQTVIPNWIINEILLQQRKKL